MSDSAHHKTHVLILSQDLIGSQMAGPGIRYWELARVLAQTCDVTLAAPTGGQLPDAGWTLHPLTLENPQELAPLLAQADVVLSNGFLLYNYPQLAELTIPWVVDAYIPSPVEGLAFYQSRPLGQQEEIHAGNVAMLKRFFACGDFFLCANERQRDLYLGVLAAVGRLNPHTYAQDASLRRLIDLVPFGLPSEPPQHRRAIFKGVQPGVAPEDKVLVWGGGIWDWLDPLTLIWAMPRILEQRQDVRLYFPGTRHPFKERVPDMEMHRRAVELSARLGLSDRFVFFGDWLPQQHRANYLLEADLGLSLHFGGIEPRFAFRTRVLDYLWAGLPMVVSEGDVLAELVRARGLGLVVPPEDPRAVAEAILQLLAEPDARAARRAAFQKTALEFRWETVAEPLIRFCQAPALAADKQAGYYLRGDPDAELLQTRRELAEARQRARTLEEQVAGYQRGRFMRVMAGLKSFRDRLLRRG